MNFKTEICAKLNQLGVSDIDVQAILDVSLQRGGDLAELFFEESISTKVIYENGKVDRIVDGTDRGVGLRVVFETKSVYGYTSDLTQAGILNLAETLSSGVAPKASSSKKKNLDQIEWRYPTQESDEISKYQVLESPREIGIDQKIEYLKRMDASARKELPDARQVTAGFLDRLRNILVVNSDGLISPDSKTYLQAFTQVVGEKDGRVEVAYDTDGGCMGLELFKSVSPETIGKNAARRVRILLGAEPAPAGTMAVVMSSEAGGTMIHEAVGHGLEADLACNDLSVYSGKLGQKVASPLVTVVDDGTLPARRGSSVFDDEGTPSKKNVLIEKGVLKSYMVDRLSAMKFDLMATGNGRRESFRHKPIVRMTNTYIAPGEDDPDQILKDTKKGIFVKSMGGGQVNTVNGDFVFAVTEGYLIQDGKLGAPIRGATLVGNGPRAISIVDRVGSDLGFATGTCGKDGQDAPVTDAQPTIRIPELTVGGEVPMSKYWPE